ncbi:MAG: flagellar biosynthetic protein FliO [Phycisphaerae bacterium]
MSNAMRLILILLLVSPAMADEPVDSRNAAREAAGGFRDDAARPTAAAPQSQQTDTHADPWNAIEPPELSAAKTPLRRRPASGVSTPGVAGTSSSWLRTTASLGGVIALILLLSWGYRVALGRGGLSLAKARRPGLIQIISRASLTPRHGLALVRVGPRLVLVGVGNEGLSALDVVEDAKLAAALAGDAATQQTESHSAEFARVIADESKTYLELSAPAPAGETPAARPDDAQLGRVKRVMTEALRRVHAARSA